MKFKFKPEKSNLFLMTALLILLIVVCLIWLNLREYMYFAIYLILTLLIAFTYYFTSYYLKEKYFLTTLGFINVKIKYENIKKVEICKNRVNIYLKNFKIDVYPNNKDIFVVTLNSKLTNKNLHNIIDK